MTKQKMIPLDDFIKSGREGGKRNAEKNGSEHMSEIGKKGHQTMREKGVYSEIAKKAWKTKKAKAEALRKSKQSTTQKITNLLTGN